MAVSSATQKAFIKEFAPYAMEAYIALGKVLPSVCIGMACLESGYGTSKVMRNHNAYLGQKVGTGKTATKYWTKAFFVAKTSEEYVVGQHTVIKDAFRSYVDMRQCVYNYYELLNTSLYKRVQAGADYVTQMKQIKAVGYMTSSTEVDKVIAIIRRHELTKYDDVSNVIQPSEADHTQGEDEMLPPLIKRGSEGKTVKIWQTTLGLEATGLFDLVTEEMTRQFQTLAFPNDRNEWDGIVGNKTWSKAFETLYL